MHPPMEKMTPTKVTNQLNTLVTFLNSRDLLLDSNHVTKIINQNFSEVTYGNPSGVIREDFSELPFGSLSDYTNVIRSRNYLVLLKDGAALQISFTFKRTTVIKHRLCFYPCPIQLQSDEYEGITLIDFIELLNETELRERLVMNPPLRFDYDVEKSDEFHPNSHLHITKTHCRIPLFAPLNVGHFIRFIFKNFYLEEWKNGFNGNIKYTKMNSTLREIDRSELYFDSKLGS